MTKTTEIRVPANQIPVSRRADASIAVVGNPNSGKTTLFNELTGARQHVGNYPGVTVEKKQGTLFIGVNAGFNMQNSFAYYDMPYAFAPLQHNPDAPVVQLSIAGNINEAIDVFGKDIEMHRPAEGDYLAIVNAGGYGSSMSSNHCMRGEFSEYILFDG